VTTATPEPKPPHKHLTAGQINLSLIPADFPLTPLQGKKAYLPGWTQDPKTVAEIKQELDEGRATGVGLLCGQWSNDLALIFVDIDGEEAIPAIEALGGGLLEEIFPPTLTITSGKPGKLRMLFQVPPSRVNQLPDKATIKVDKAPWEILWRSRQGALMGAHPDTAGYYTLPHGGFEYAKRLPEMPEWLYEAIARAYPSSRYRKHTSPANAVIAQNITLNYDKDSKFHQETVIEEALEYLTALSEERADDYEEWLAVGMSLHQIDDCLLEAWVEWSSQSDHFEEGACERKWNSFERLPGGVNPEGARGLKTLRAKAKEDGYIDMGGFVVPSLETIKKQAGFNDDTVAAIHDEATLFAELFGIDLSNNGFDGEEQDEFDDDEESVTVFPGLPSIPTGKKQKGATRNPPASEIANFISPMFIRNGWRYDPRFDRFMKYDKQRGVWNEQDHTKDFKHEVQFVLGNTSLPGGYTSHLVTDVCSLLEGHLTEYQWNDDPSRLAFRNGVFDLDTQEFIEHDPDHFIIWGLDIDYIPESDPGPITEWLYRTQYGDEDRVNVLRAWLRACLVGRGNEIQRFLEIIGPGGRGKSTFANLCCALVGNGNYASTTLNQLEQSRFELSSIKGKRLTLINDSERYGGSAQTFKALTGGDSLRYEEKLKPIGEPFVYTGMVMVVANEPIQTTDNTSGLSRRRLTIEFNRPLYEKNSEAKDMIKIQYGRVSGIWKDYLPGLVNWVLEMDEETMRQYLLDTNEMVPALRRVRNNILLNSNNLIEWLQSEVVQTESVSAVGKKIFNNTKETNERYLNSDYHLYPSYCEYCDSTGSKAVGQKRFINLLLDCCKNQLNLDNVHSFSKGGKPFVKGLAIRNSDKKYKDYPTILPEGKDQ
jgi:P4 family phage/plasmid primase-like protien